MTGAGGPIDAFIGERTEIDHLLTADFAEIVNGKLYVMGAGWDTITPPEYPTTIRLGIVVGIRVPYRDAGTKHHVTITLRNGPTELLRMEADVETNRRPGGRVDATLVPLAVNHIIPLAEPGALELTADVDGRSSRRIVIRAERRT